MSPIKTPCYLIILFILSQPFNSPLLAETSSVGQLNEYKLKYAEAVKDNNHRKAAKYSEKILVIYQEILDPKQEKIGIQALTTGIHYVNSKRLDAALPFLKQAVEIISEKNVSQIKLAYETLLIALSAEMQNTHPKKIDKYQEEFTRNTQILACIILPPVPAEYATTELIEGGNLKFPEDFLKWQLRGWAMITFTIDENGKVRDTNFLSIWPEEYLKEPTLEWLDTIQFKPVIRDGQAVRIKNVPHSINFILKNSGVDSITNRAKWRKEKHHSNDINCKDIINIK